MVDVVTSGTGGSVNFGNMAIAGKTGTTSDYKDVWFSGYTPYYTATTWTGYDNSDEARLLSRSRLGICSITDACLKGHSSAAESPQYPHILEK